MQKKNIFSDAKILVDYLAFTVSLDDFASWDERNLEHVQERIESKFMLAGLDFEGRKGFYGYLHSQWYNGITYCFGGQNHIYIQMSGTGCRTWESCHPGLPWESWLRQLQATYPSLHIARLDIAYDTFGALKLPLIIKYTRLRKYVSYWKTYLINEGNKEMSVIWGSGKSDSRLRIYDKTLERRKVVGDGEAVPDGWVRCEHQMRNNFAGAFVREWLATEDLSAVFFGVLGRKLQYVTQYDGKNTDRMVVAPWWRRLLQDYPKIKLACSVGIEYNLQHLERYVYGQAGSSIKALLAAKGGDLSGFLAMIERKDYNDRQKTLLETLRHADAAAHQPVSCGTAYVCSVCGHFGPDADFAVCDPTDKTSLCRKCATQADV